MLLNLPAVYGVSSAGYESTAGNSNTFTRGHGTVFLPETGNFRGLGEGRAVLTTSDVEVIAGAEVGLHAVEPSDLDRIESEVVANHVEKALECKPRLRRAVSPESPAGGLVRHYPSAGVLVVGNFVQRRNHAPRIIRGDDAKGRVRSSVEVDLALECSDRPVLFYSQFHVNVLFVPAAMKEEHFLAGINHLYRTAGLLGQYGRAQIERCGSGLSAEAASDRGSYDLDFSQRYVEHVGDHIVDVVRNLRG